MSHLGLYYDTWALHCTERTFRNLIIQDLDTIMYYWDSDIFNMDCKPISHRGDRWDMARELTHVHHASSLQYGGKMKLLA